MKISPGHLTNAQELLRILKEDPKVTSVTSKEPVSESKDTKPDPSKVQQGSEGEKVSLSDHGRTAQLIQAAVEEAPDVREDKVAEIKKAVDDGTYEVDGNKVAEAMLREQAVDTLLLRDMYK
jgi:negative regulator of flagellin synthesis FlgM